VGWQTDHAPPRLAPALLLAACVLALAACGGGGAKKVSADQYTSSVCSTLKTWQNKIKAGSTTLSQTARSSSSLKEVRAKFVTFFDTSIAATDEMLKKLGQAGAPNVKNGSKFAAELLHAIGKAKPILVEARSKAEKLPLNDPAQFGQLAQGIGTSAQSQLTNLGKSFAALKQKVPALAQAGKKNPVCQGL